MHSTTIATTGNTTDAEAADYATGFAQALRDAFAAEDPANPYRGQLAFSNALAHVGQAAMPIDLAETLRARVFRDVSNDLDYVLPDVLPLRLSA